MVNLKTGDLELRLEIEGVVQELYDVAVLPGITRPMVDTMLARRRWSSGMSSSAETNSAWPDATSTLAEFERSVTADIVAAGEQYYRTHPLKSLDCAPVVAMLDEARQAALKNHPSMSTASV